MDNTSIDYCSLADNCIRLLRLHSNTLSKSVGQLISVDLDQAPQYYALSYCWGAQKETVPIQIGCFTQHVSGDLGEGIRTLQHLAANNSFIRPKINYVWIDKLCINQNDNKERERQVQLMGKIFSGSIRTLIWLGSGIKDNSPSPWPLVDQLYQAFRTEHPTATSQIDIDLKLYSGTYHKSSGLPDWDCSAWESLRKLFDLPWFTRIWVVQEVALSPEDPLILHGDSIYSWEKLGWVASYLRRRGYIRLDHFPERTRSVDSMANIRRSRCRWPLDVLLTETSVKFNATDQRDKVYGLLGLALESLEPSAMPDALRPDYTLATEQVYRRVALFLLQRSKSLAALTRTSIGSGFIARSTRKHDLESLPTWTPDWSDIEKPRRTAVGLAWISYSEILRPSTLGFPHQYAASREFSSKALGTSQSNPGVLNLGGIRIDRVSQAIYFAPESASSNNSATIFKQIWELVDELNSGIRDQAWIENLIKSTTAAQNNLGGIDDGQIIKDGCALLLDVVEMQEAAKRQPTGSGSSSQDALFIQVLRRLSIGGDAAAFASLVNNYCLNRKFIVTSDGHVGIGPADADAGDVVAILSGGQIPYIIREGVTGWAFIGESYFHSLNNGQKIENEGEGSSQEEVFQFT